jgi:hypothetical protein
VESDTLETTLIGRSNSHQLQSAIDELPVQFREVIPSMRGGENS